MKQIMRNEEGKQVYIFDLDDNTFFLKTKIFIENKVDGSEKGISTHEFSLIRDKLGEFGEWKDWGLYDDTSISYRHFRDHDKFGSEQYLVSDLKEVINSTNGNWKGPAFSMLEYACKNQHPVAFVTARGHTQNTIKKAIKVMVDTGHLISTPDYLKIFAVSNEKMRDELINLASQKEKKYILDLIKDRKDPTSPLKRLAIRNIVEETFNKFGYSKHHTFGMSDDDPNNVDLALIAMCECKKKHMENRFFVINTHHNQHVKMEVFPIEYSVTGGFDYCGNN